MWQNAREVEFLRKEFDYIHELLLVRECSLRYLLEQ